MGLFSMFLLAMMPHIAAADESEDHFVSALDRHNFAKETQTGAEDLLVVFCDDAVESCKHMVESLKKLTVIWRGMEQFPGSRFAEVSCTQDNDVCKQERITVFPAAVHYRNGIRLASWNVEGDQPSPVWQFVAWVRSELSPIIPEPKAPDQSPDISADAAAQFSLLAPFVDMDRETAAVGWVLVLAAVGIVAWVVVEGFELWPAVAGKKVGNTIPAF